MSWSDRDNKAQREALEARMKKLREGDKFDFVLPWRRQTPGDNFVKPLHKSDDTETRPETMPPYDRAKKRNGSRNV